VTVASSVAAVAVRSTVMLGTTPSDSVSVAGQIAGSTALRMSGSTSSGHHVSLGIADPSSARVIWLPNESGTILTSASDYNVAAVSVQGFDSANGVIEIAGTRVARASRSSGAGSSLSLAGQSSIGSPGGDVRIAGGAAGTAGPDGHAILRSPLGQGILSTRLNAMGVGDGNDFTIQRHPGTAAGSVSLFRGQTADMGDGGSVAIKAGATGGLIRILGAAGNVEVGSTVSVTAPISSASINAGSSSIGAGSLRVANTHSNAILSPSYDTSGALDLTTVANAHSLAFGGVSDFLLTHAHVALSVGSNLQVQAGRGIDGFAGGENLVLAAGDGLQHGDLLVSIGGPQIFRLSENAATLFVPTSVASSITTTSGTATDDTITVVSTVYADDAATLTNGLLTVSVAVGSLLSPSTSAVVMMGTDAPLRTRSVSFASLRFCLSTTECFLTLVQCCATDGRRCEASRSCDAARFRRTFLHSRTGFFHSQRW
jgi:hypothetical protein